MNDEYLLYTSHITITIRINGLSENNMVKFFDSFFDKEVLQDILHTQIESENYEICPIIHKALNKKV